MAWAAGIAKSIAALCLAAGLASCATLADGHSPRSVASPQSDGHATAAAATGSEPGRNAPDAPDGPSAGSPKVALNSAPPGVASSAADSAEVGDLSPYERVRDSLEAAIAAAESGDELGGGQPPPADSSPGGASRGERAPEGSVHPEANESLVRDLRQAEDALSQISVEKLAGGADGLLDHPFPSPIRLRVVDSGGKSLADIPIIATLTSTGADAGPVSETVGLRTDVTGVAELRLPTPVSVGRAAVTIALDLKRELALLEQLAPKLGPQSRELVAKIERSARSKQVQVSYVVTVESAKVPTGILIVDVDGRNNFVWGDATTSGLVSELSPLGFKLVAVPSNPGLLGIDDPNLLGLVQNNFAGQFRRVILGHAVLTQFQSGAGRYSAGARAELEVVDLATGKVLTTATSTGEATDPTAMGAINGAFRAAGQKIGIAIANRLP